LLLSYKNDIICICYPPRRAGAEFHSFVDDVFPFTSIWMPYALRHYHRPGSPQTFFDHSGYSQESHSRNLNLLATMLDIHGNESGRTGWLSNGAGILAVKHSGLKFKFRSVQYMDDSMQYRQGVHYVQDFVTVHEKRGLKAKTKVYPTLGKLAANFTSSDAVWVMSYPSLREDPEGASAHLAEWLQAPHDLEPIDNAGIKKMFPERHAALRHWVRVK